MVYPGMHSSIIGINAMTQGFFLITLHNEYFRRFQYQKAIAKSD